MFDPFKVPKPSREELERERLRKQEFEKLKIEFEQNVLHYLKKQHEKKPAYYPKPRVPHRQREDGLRSYD